MLIRKYYNTHKNKNDNILENIDEIEKILEELNEEPSEDKTLIDKIIKPTEKLRLTRGLYSNIIIQASVAGLIAKVIGDDPCFSNK